MENNLINAIFIVIFLMILLFYNETFLMKLNSLLKTDTKQIIFTKKL